MRILPVGQRGGYQASDRGARGLRCPRIDLARDWSSHNLLTPPSGIPLRFCQAVRVRYPGSSHADHYARTPHIVTTPTASTATYPIPAAHH